ncbi:hypothetical protein MYAM1_003080 [Malassezia yamatoensis]|uniref:Peroxin/Ferlin domain-containing protein n=1 Tax=Malassezia yamatoensis TaxID=253288 RepID=A0AAJ6CK41_9BASI|nr:hypothetical protein MYAM1_003080 [Malassezia yamatoensis]
MSEGREDRNVKKNVQTMSLMEILENVPPSMIQLLVALGPAIDKLHWFLVLATWRGGYQQRVQSWLLLLGYVLLCLYGYEVLRYAPQIVPLGIIGYLSLRASFSRVAGVQQNDGQGATSQDIKRSIAQLCDLSDFVSAFCETLVYPVYSLVHLQIQNAGASHLIIFLLVSWPIWLLVMLPFNQWATPYYYVTKSAGDLLGSDAVVKLSSYVQQTIRPAVVKHSAQHAPRIYAMSVHGSHFINKYVMPVGCALLRFLDPSRWHLKIQFMPPFPLGALSVRHVFLMLGIVALTWCSPWATLIRMALWRSALVRRIVKRSVQLMSGQDVLSTAWRSVAPKRLHSKGSVLVKNTQNAVVHETVFQFEIYENQRWWIGLDWTAALLPNERASWSDLDNNAVAPPSSFTLPGAVRTRVPSSVRPGRDDTRIAEWHWVDLEWRVAGAQSITSTVYTPASSMSASEAQRLSSRFSSEDHLDKQGSVMDATDRLQAATEAASKSAAPSKREEDALEDAQKNLPEELSAVARPAALASTASDVDPEGWQYGDNSWDKLSRVNGIGKYTRRRCWVRRAVLVVTVEHGAARPVQDE